MDRNAPLLPISIVKQITQLTPRQIRYYEQQGLIQPTRTNGKQRMFSFYQVDQLMKIKELINKGMNIAGVKEILKRPTLKEDSYKEIRREITEEELRSLLKRELIHPNRSGLPHLMHGELSRFFKNT